MAAPIKPALKRAFGNDSWTFVPAIASAAAPTEAEVQAATGFNFSCSVFADQEGISGATEKVKLPRLLCETEVYEFNGETSYSAADLQVSFDPQGAALSDGKLGWEALGDYEAGFLVQRQGVAGTTDFAAGDFVNVFPATLGKKVPSKTSTGTDGAYSFTVGVSITSQPTFNVAIVV